MSPYIFKSVVEKMDKPSEALNTFSRFIRSFRPKSQQNIGFVYSPSERVPEKGTIVDKVESTNQTDRKLLGTLVKHSPVEAR